jgi:hypothetical protein
MAAPAKRDDGGFVPLSFSPGEAYQFDSGEVLAWDRQPPRHRRDCR